MRADHTAIGVDIGGTFTDVVMFRREDGAMSLKWSKTPTTPKHLVSGILTGINNLLSQSGAGMSSVTQIMHGTTVATNAVLEQKGARIGILATDGFEDTLEIGRQKRSQLYDVFLEPETPSFLCPRSRRRGVVERIASDGSVLVPLDEAQLKDQAVELLNDGVQALAVCFLFSFQNRAHELKVREVLQGLDGDIPLSLSHEINPVFREYERLCVTAFDAYLRPVMESYLSELRTSLAEASYAGTVQTMKSRGGLASTEAATRRPVTTLLSGPAAGVVGARFVARTIGVQNVVTIDMGGTSADIAVVKEGKPLTSNTGRIGSFPLSIPMVDVQTIGAGGGSIAWLDGAGGLRVGPMSAGSDPGPACYGTGGEEPTVTDASLILGYIDPYYFAGGQQELDVEAAHAAIDRIARPLGMSLTEAALGIHRIANARMADAIRLASLKRGYDPRESVLMAFGGAGPVCAAMLADDLLMERSVIPRTAGVLSALGLLVSNVEYDNARTFVCSLNAVDGAAANEILDELFRFGAAQMASDGYTEDEWRVTYSADMRFVGQSSELEVPLMMPMSLEHLPLIRAAFEQEHERVYGYAPPDTPIEFVNLRAVHIREPAWDLAKMLEAEGPLRGERGLGPSARRGCVFPTGEYATDVFLRTDLPVGFSTRGPAIIEQEDTTVVVTPGHSCHLDRWGNVIIDRLG